MNRKINKITEKLRKKKCKTRDQDQQAFVWKRDILIIHSQFHEILGKFAH